MDWIPASNVLRDMFGADFPDKIAKIEEATGHQLNMMVVGADIVATFEKMGLHSRVKYLRPYKRLALYWLDYHGVSVWSL